MAAQGGTYDVYGAANVYRRVNLIKNYRGPETNCNVVQRDSATLQRAEENRAN